MLIRSRFMFSAFFVLALGCGSSDEAPSDDDDDDDGDASVSDGDASVSDGDASVVSPDAGAEVCPVKDYSPCGGKIGGIWHFAGMCADTPDSVPCENPFPDQPACTASGNEVACQLLAEGTLTFKEGQVRVVRSATVEAQYTFSADCLAAIRPEGADAAARCTELGSGPKLDCTFEDDACHCSARTETEPTDKTQPFTHNGDRLTLGEVNATYCVEGERLTLDLEPHPKSWRYWVLTR